MATRSEGMTTEPIDAVITWVDGNDKAHSDKLALYLARMGIERPEAAAPTRYNQCGEINYCVNSILRFAPWIRTIYIVTDAQIPPIMEQLVGTPQQEKVKLIDHRDIFHGFEASLPTFNSLTIECMLWRINGLSNKFIYLNDDCSFIRPVSPDDFFRGDNIVFRGLWRVQSERTVVHYLKKCINYVFKTPQNFVKPGFFRTVQENSAKMAGWHKLFFQFPHAPFALKKQTFEDYFLKHPNVLSQNIGYPLRNNQQFWPLSLFGYLEIKQNKVVFDNSLGAITVNGAFHSWNKMRRRLSLADRKKNVAFVCMQSIDEAPIETQSAMLEWLDNSNFSHRG